MYNIGTAQMNWITFHQISNLKVTLSYI